MINLSLVDYVHAQYANLKFENYSTMEGLSSSTCVEIFQDSDGFLWFGTIDGLNKFDGYEFKIYRPVINDPHSISSNRITSIVEDHNKNLWVGTSNGLNVLNKSTGKFIRIDLEKRRPTIVNKNDVINDLLFDSRPYNLWIASKDGLSKLNLERVELNAGKNISFEHYVHDPDDPYTIDNNNVTSIGKDNQNNIWLGTAGQHLHKYNAGQNNFDRIPINIQQSYELDHIPKQILIDHEGDFWIGNDLSRIVFWDRKKNSFKLRSFAERHIPLFHIYQDTKDVIWFATDGYGIYFLDKEKGSTKHLTHNPDDPFSLPNNQPSKILEDNEGLFWIATYNEGVCKLDLSKSTFRHYFYQPGDKNSLSARIAQSVMQDSKKQLWIGTDGGGLNLFREQSGTFTHFRANTDDPHSISSDKILYLLESYNGSIWVCTWDGGLNKFNPGSGRAIQYTYNPAYPFSIGQNTVWCAAEDSLHRLWLGTQNAGLNLMDPKTQKFYKYQHRAGDSTSLISDFVFSLFIDSQNRLYAGTALGLCVANLNEFEDFIPGQIGFKHVKAGGFQGNRVNYITEDSAGNIWVGTDIGMYKMNSNLEILNTYTTRDGLLNNIVLGIAADDNGFLWITTKSGLSRLDPVAHTFTNFNVHDGLQGIEFQSKSIEKTHDGHIIIGGINGFNIFNPEDISMDMEKVKLLITEFKLFHTTIQAGDTVNNRVLLNKPITNTRNMELKHDEGYITYEFVALYFQNPERVHYAYKMDGLDKDFIYSRSNRIANYSNLPPGDYVFEVKASIDGIWENATSTKININVLTPWWKTWKFRSAVILFIISSFFMFYYIRIRQIKKQKKFLEVTVERRTMELQRSNDMLNETNTLLEERQQRIEEQAEEISANVKELNSKNIKLNELVATKDKFFSIIAHDLKNPFNIMLGMGDLLLTRYQKYDDGKRLEIIGNINSSAKKIYALLENLLHWARSQMGTVEFEPDNINIYDTAQSVFNLVSDQAGEKGLELKNELVNPTYVFADQNMINTVLRNLVTNALKYTEHGTITIDAVTEKRVVVISVKDTGTGMNAHEQKKIFKLVSNRSKKGTKGETGTGLGLILCKDFIEKNNGKIWVESEPGKGTTFFISLPKHKNG